jgi:hypothetical protein
VLRSPPQNSTLVLTADTRSRDPKEPDGSAATLWGKINPKSFGNRVQFSKPGSEGDAKRCVLLRAGGADKQTPARSVSLCAVCVQSAAACRLRRARAAACGAALTLGQHARRVRWATPRRRLVYNARCADFASHACAS